MLRELDEFVQDHDEILNALSERYGEISLYLRADSGIK